MERLIKVMTQTTVHILQLEGAVAEPEAQLVQRRMAAQQSQIVYQALRYIVGAAAVEV